METGQIREYKRFGVMRKWDFNSWRVIRSQNITDGDWSENKTDEDWSH